MRALDAWIAFLWQITWFHLILIQALWDGQGGCHHLPPPNEEHESQKGWLANHLTPSECQFPHLSPAPQQRSHLSDVPSRTMEHTPWAPWVWHPALLSLAETHLLVREAPEMEAGRCLLPYCWCVVEGQVCKQDQEMSVEMSPQCEEQVKFSDVSKPLPFTQ